MSILLGRLDQFTGLQRHHSKTPHKHQCDHNQNNGGDVADLQLTEHEGQGNRHRDLDGSESLKLGCDGVVGEKLLKYADAIGPAHLHLKSHQAVTHPHQGVDINGFVDLLLLRPGPVVLVLIGVHRTEDVYLQRKDDAEWRSQRHRP
ncbi:hypothetical [Parasynechococcus marenigrum WH 8102]|uniref:Uncharacterized protein n=1 Tax=Parasynechococcus marenigrum (strain WH8102) TaxID=84588 RepID=Q7U6C9_PARMW|nr:hypothetical [Parasynechococcus marenigrum WH 8102]